jgi:hypothetical protein
MSNARATLRLRPGATPEQTRDARARAWAFVFECYAKKKAARLGSPDDGEESRNASTAKPEYNR